VLARQVDQWHTAAAQNSADAMAAGWRPWLSSAWASAQVLAHEFLNLPDDTGPERNHGEHEDSTEDGVYPVTQRPLGELVFQIDHEGGADHRAQQGAGATEQGHQDDRPRDPVLCLFGRE